MIDDLFRLTNGRFLRKFDFHETWEDWLSKTFFTETLEAAIRIENVV